MLHLIRAHEMADGEGCYAVLHTGKDAPRVQKLFGTTTLPTPFRLSMDAEEVMRRLEPRNPGIIDSTLDPRYSGRS